MTHIVLKIHPEKYLCIGIITNITIYAVFEVILGLCNIMLFLYNMNIRAGYVVNSQHLFSTGLSS